jgi:hypothetical protein
MPEAARTTTMTAQGVDLLPAIGEDAAYALDLGPSGKGWGEGGRGTSKPSASTRVAAEG